jgi:O-antigen/teichoic acid export membrane protein
MIKLLKSIFSNESNRSTTVVKGSLLMIISSLITNLTRVGLVIVLSRYYSKEEFGIWAAITSIGAILVTGDFGITNALRNKISFLIPKGKEGLLEAQKYFYSSFFFFLILAVVISVVLFLLKNYLPYSTIFRTNNQFLISEGTYIVYWIQVLFLIGLPLGIGNGLFFSFQESAFIAIWSVSSSIIIFIVTLIPILFKASIIIISLSYFISSTVLSALLTVVFIYKRRWYMWKINFRDAYLRVKELLATGIKFMGLQLSGSFLQNAGTIATSSLIGVSVAAEFNMVTKLFTFISSIYQSIFNPIWGAFGDASARRDWPWCKKMSNRVVYLTLLFYISIIVFISIFGNLLLSLLAGSQYRTNLELIILVGIGSMACILFEAQSVFLKAISKVNVMLLFFLILSFTSTPLLKLFVSSFNVNGIALWSILIWLLLFFIVFLESKYLLKRFLNNKNDSPNTWFL